MTVSLAKTLNYLSKIHTNLVPVLSPSNNDILCIHVSDIEHFSDFHPNEIEISFQLDLVAIMLVNNDAYMGKPYFAPV